MANAKSHLEQLSHQRRNFFAVKRPMPPTTRASIDTVEGRDVSAESSVLVLDEEIDWS